jgi:hypothetical protein
LKHAAALLEMHKVKGIPYDPAQDGFDFSKSEIEAFSQRLMRLNESRHIEYVRFHAPYSASLSKLPPSLPKPMRLRCELPHAAKFVETCQDVPTNDSSD